MLKIHDAAKYIDNVMYPRNSMPTRCIYLTSQKRNVKESAQSLILCKKIRQKVNYQFTPLFHSDLSISRQYLWRHWTYLVLSLNVFSNLISFVVALIDQLLKPCLVIVDLIVYVGLKYNTNWNWTDDAHGDSASFFEIYFAKLKR